MAMFEDYTFEEISTFSNIEDALNYFRGYQKPISKLNDKK